MTAPLDLPLIPTTLTGSYVQPDWLVDREKLTGRPPARARGNDIWRIDGDGLEDAQDAATLMAIRTFEEAGLDILTDGEIRRESYSNRFHTALDGIDVDNPAMVPGRSPGKMIPVPRITGPLSPPPSGRGAGYRIPAPPHRPADQDDPARAVHPVPGLGRRALRRRGGRRHGAGGNRARRGG